MDQAFLTALAEYAWLLADKKEAAIILESFSAELTEYQDHLLDEVIFGCGKARFDECRESDVEEND